MTSASLALTEENESVDQCGCLIEVDSHSS